MSGGISVPIQVYKTREKGWAGRAKQFISKGTFVVEYCGEVVDAEEAAKRLTQYDMLGIHYVFGFKFSNVW
jgi:histone-lysine N-methyltransferase SUV39H